MSNAVVMLECRDGLCNHLWLRSLDIPRRFIFFDHLDHLCVWIHHADIYFCRFLLTTDPQRNPVSFMYEGVVFLEAANGESKMSEVVDLGLAL